jgi:hypothetical protein
MKWWPEVDNFEAHFLGLSLLVLEKYFFTKAGHLNF